MRRTITHRGAAGVLSWPPRWRAGCGGSPPANITLAAPAAVFNPGESGRPGHRAHQVGVNKPDCKGDCPRIEIDSVAFPAYPS